jgi:catechol 2,3-dioxygenase-like lactoylglutathione lyase family enzyme
MLKFVSPLIVVEDMARSRQFYEQLLGQKVKFDFGVDVAFEGDFTIHLKSHFQSLLGEASRYPITSKAHNGELYFDADEIESIYQRLQAAGVEFIEEIQEQPWGQRAMRLYDPDGHILEIGEPMDMSVRRFYGQGWSIERIAQKTGMPHRTRRNPMTHSESPEHNPALNTLEVLVGEWEMALSNASFLPDPSDTVIGQVSIEWAENGAFLVMYMGTHPKTMPDAIWLIGRDETQPNYSVLYYDARKVSRVYEMSFLDGVWKMWRNAPGFSQRYDGKVSADGDTISADWEISEDGQMWEHDFSITYTRRNETSHS